MPFIESFVTSLRNCLLLRLLHLVLSASYNLICVQFYQFSFEIRRIASLFCLRILKHRAWRNNTLARPILAKTCKVSLSLGTCAPDPPIRIVNHIYSAWWMIISPTMLLWTTRVNNIGHLEPICYSFSAETALAPLQNSQRMFLVRSSELHCKLFGSNLIVECFWR